MSTISTHVLDTSKGKPAANIEISLEVYTDTDEWRRFAQSKTNNDGRAPDLLPKSHNLEEGTYKITFDTESYFKENGTKGFYPFVSIVFEIGSDEHYHVPLLLNPFGYSTYRGS
jgi:5-hydroxyisourate hydrolase